MILQGKRLLITGSAKRIGSVIAEKAAAAGCRVLIHCCKSGREAANLLEKLPGSGHKIICADLSSESGVEHLISEAGNFDLLVNSAALFFRPDSAEDIQAEKLYRQVNFRAPEMLLSHLYSSDLSEAAAVNITDINAMLPGHGAYWQSKHDLNELTIKLAPLWAKKNFRINAVAPGPMIPPPWAPESKMEKIIKTMPLARAVSVDDLASVVLMQLSCDSMTGTIIPLGGMPTRA